MPLDLARSQAIAARIQAAPQACWYNAFRAMSCPDLPDPVLYVEGWAVEEPWGLVFEHGWVESGSAIIDPTPGASRDRTYVAGLRLAPAAVLQRIAITSIHRPPFIRTYDHSSAEYTTYTTAYLQAWVLARLRQVLAPLDACGDLEGAGLTCCLHTLLTAAEVAHQSYVGTATWGTQTTLPHWWITLTNGWRIDYRARRWLGADPAVPHGIHQPADYPTLQYLGTLCDLTADPDRFRRLAPACDLARLTAAVREIPYRGQILSHRQEPAT